MIYLICGCDSKNRVAEITQKDYQNNKFFKYLYDSTYHKNVLYPIEFYEKSKKILPNRINVIYTTKHHFKKNLIRNAIIINSTKEIIQNYKNNVDDIFILVTHSHLLDIFSSLADFLIIYNSNDIGHSYQQIVDCLNFANFNLLKIENFSNYSISYFVRINNNFIGY